MMAKAKYLEIADIINQRIDNGTYPKESLLPDQQTLAKELGVSRLTVKKALDGLEREGRVFKQSGLGTFVAEDIPIQSKIDTPANAFSGLQSLLGANKVTSKIINFSVEFPNQHLQRYLHLKETEPIYNIIRLRLLDKKPYVIEHTYMPVSLVPDLNDSVLHSSIYDYIHQKLHLKFGHAYRRIKAARASKYDEKYLNAQASDPMIDLEQIVWLTNGQPIEYSLSRSRYDQRVYTIFENNRF